MAMERISRWHGLGVNWDEITVHLPTDGSQLDLRQFVEIASRAGFVTRVVKRRLKAIPAAVLPAVLLLKENGIGLLEPDGEGGADLFQVGGDGNWERVPTSRVPAAYAGFAVYLRPSALAGEWSSTPLPAPTDSRWWFWSALWKLRGDLGRALPASILVNLAALAMPIFTMTIYDRVVPNDAMETLWVLAIGAMLVFFFEFLLRLLRGSFLHRVGKNLDASLATMLYEHIMAIDMRGKPASSGALAAKARSYEALREFFTSACLVALVDVPISLLMIAVIFHIAGPVGWVPVGAAILMLTTSLLLRFPLRRAAKDSYQRNLRRQSALTETIHNLEAVKAANAQGPLRLKMERLIRGSAESESHAHSFTTLGSSLTSWINNTSVVLLVIGCVFRLHEGFMTMGGMIACIILSSRALSPMAQAASMATRLEQVGASLRGLGEIIALPLEYGGGRKYAHLEDIQTHYELRGVRVAFKDRARPALKNLQLEILPGQHWAVIGPIGSGKSTLLRLLTRMVDAEDGQVLLNGLELKQYHPAAVRRVVGYMPQDVALFFGSLRDNIALGHPMARDEEITEAATMAGLADYINQHPAGLSAPVNEGGYGFSGGERQAIGLARCLLGRPTMLLLDEPTSSMDTRLEKAVLAALRNYLNADKRRTLVVATHKMAVLEIADYLLVLDQGNELMAGPKKVVLEKLRENQPIAQQL
jgi:ATP-binding cassette subfamily C protein LapB